MQGRRILEQQRVANDLETAAPEYGGFLLPGGKWKEVPSQHHQNTNTNINTNTNTNINTEPSCCQGIMESCEVLGESMYLPIIKKYQLSRRKFILLFSFHPSNYFKSYINQHKKGSTLFHHFGYFNFISEPQNSRYNQF